jgi:8-oxo-dGTP pyrophosphatase MutT (NUDIX family)
VTADTGRRRQYYRDENAPAPHDVLATAFAVVRDPAGRVLLVRRADDGYWELPGGRIDVGESASAAAVREVAEEAGVEVKVTDIAGVYSEPGHVLAYPDGRVHQQLAVCFRAWPIGGTARPDGRETSAAVWFDPAATAELPMHPSMRRRLDHALAEPAAAQFD